MDECKPLMGGARALPRRACRAWGRSEEAHGKGLHSFPFPLNLSLRCPYPLTLSLPCPPCNLD